MQTFPRGAVGRASVPVQRALVSDVDRHGIHRVVDELMDRLDQALDAE
jgi:hypothetical protein